MIRSITGAVTLSLMATTALAGGLDRSGQSISALFNDEGSASFSFGTVTPNVTGASAGESYDIGQSYTQFGASYTGQVNDQFGYAVIVDQPFGADIAYNGAPATTLLGGTSASLSSEALTILGKYQLNDSFSVFGGLRAQRVSARVALNGQAYAAAISAASGGAITAAAFTATGGYSANFSSDVGVGYTLGAAYEIPEIALRTVLTYHSRVEHTATTNEFLGVARPATQTTYESPQSANLEFQTGIAADTLLSAGVRWVEWSSVNITPAALGQNLVSLSDSTTYRLGLARRFNESFSGSVGLTYERSSNRPTVSPLGPTDGVVGLTIGGQYTQDNVKVSGGINYSWLGDANAGVGGAAVASFTNNSAVGVGFRVEIGM